MVVGWCLCDLAHRPGLNRVLHGGRVPPQGLGAEPQDLAGLCLPRHLCRPGALDGHEGPWGLGRRASHRGPGGRRARCGLAPHARPAGLEKVNPQPREVQDEDSTTGRRSPVAADRPDMNRLHRGRGLLPGRGVRYARRAVARSGLSRAGDGAGHGVARQGLRPHRTGVTCSRTGGPGPQWNSCGDNACPG